MRTVRLQFATEAAFLAVAPEGFERADEWPAPGAPLPEGVEALYFLPPRIVGSNLVLDPDDPEGLRLIETGTPSETPGFFVNALGVVPEGWLPYVITPASPLHTFDGPVLDGPVQGDCCEIDR